MSGVRIQHPTERSCTFTLVDSDRPYREPLVCSAQIVVDGAIRPCGRTHAFKTYHLNLDESGAAIVSPEIWERVGRKLLAGGFRLANEVKEPPGQIVRIPFIKVQARAIEPTGASRVQIN